MSKQAYAWATHAPADYMLVFVEEPDGEHAVVTARFESEGELLDASKGLGGCEVSEDHRQLSVYCTLPGEPEDVLGRLEASASEAWIERGAIAFVAVGDSEGTGEEVANRRRNVSARVVLSGGGAAPRCYVFSGQCESCGEFHGKIIVQPQGAMLIDTRTLTCRCKSIGCRYCEDGRVRRPLSEHFDPERRSGTMPWFGYLVPCGACQAARRGPAVQMSV